MQGIDALVSKVLRVSVVILGLRRQVAVESKR